MLNNNSDFVQSVHAERLAARKRLPADAGELEQLMLAASAGDSAAWSSLMRRFTARLRAVVRSHRLPAHDVEDVIQSTWVRLYENIGNVREPLALGAWLETTARRESVRVLRSSQRERASDDEQLVAIADQVPAVDENRLAAKQDRTAVAQALTGLSPHQRRLLALLFADPAPSYDEISRTLEMPIGSIGPTRARILERLRRDPRLVRAMADRLD
jgi:RNA polymerase sigma factor (sigma-70 family)